MKAILIDPFDRNITEVEYSGDFKEIYQHIDCQLFDVVRIDRTNSIFVDDEGLISGKAQAFFKIDGYPEPLAGKGLMLGADDEGESISPSLTLNEVRGMVDFVVPVRINGQIVFLQL